MRISIIESLPLVFKIKSIHMNTLLIPTDFSPIADNALTYAMDMAAHYQFDVTLYHVVLVSNLISTDAVYLDSIPGFQQQAEEKMAEKVKALKVSHPTLNFHTKVETGLFLDSLSTYCDEINPIAVIMGITGDGGSIDKIIGSNAISSMNTLTYPMIIVPKHAAFKPVQKICMACDLQQVASSTPLLPLKAFALLTHAELHILNIDYKNRHFKPEAAEELATLEQMLENIPHQFHFIEHEVVQDALSDFIDQNNIDLLIMIPKKHSFFESLFHKSRTKEMLYHSHVPVLALHQR